MRLLREAVSGIWRLQSRGLTIPSICYDACNNANLEAQSVGKTAELCDPNSAFFKYYSVCQDCINTYSNNSQGTTRDYLDQTFGQYLDYCGGAVPITGTPIGIPSSTPSLAGDTVVVTILYTGTVDGVRTVWPLEKTVTSFAPIPDTTVIAIETSQDGHRTIWTFTKTFTHLPSDALISVLQNTSSPTVTQDVSTPTPRMPDITASSPTATAKSESTQSNRAWVAGPVIGGVAGIVILLVVAGALLRAKRNRESKRKGQELHGESALKSELEVKSNPQELDAQGENRQPVELPTNTL